MQTVLAVTVWPGELFSMALPVEVYQAFFELQAWQLIFEFADFAITAHEIDGDSICIYIVSDTLIWHRL